MVIFFIVLLLAGAAIEFYSIKVGLRNIDFSIATSTDRTEPDMPFSVEWTTSNKSALPVTFVRAEIFCPDSVTLPASKVIREEDHQIVTSEIFRYMGRQRITRSVPATLSKRGVHSFRGYQLFRGDFLGFTGVKEKYPCTAEIMVYPAPYVSDTLENSLGTFCGYMLAQRHLIRDPILTAGMREYTGTEPMKNISWIRTAAAGDIMVREFDYTRDISCSVVLFANGLSPREYDMIDTCCSISRTVCENLIDKGVNVDFFTNAEMWGKRDVLIHHCTAGKIGKGELLEILARVTLWPQCTADELAVEASRAAGSGTAYIIIAPHDIPAVRDAERILYEASGIKPALIFGDEAAEQE